MTQPARRILVVDDDVDTCRNLSDILSDLGYEVGIAHSGSEALGLAERVKFDLALLDLKMPGMDGLTLFRELRRRQPSTVAIIVTAYASTETAEQALDAGACRIISKPVDLSILLPLVKESTNPPLVLIVDDDRDVCESLRDVLEEGGYRISVAHDEREASNAMENAEYRVILLDMKLPGGDARRTYRHIRKVRPESRVVIITGFRHDFEQLIEQVLSEGADAICYKPFDIRHLLKTVDSLSRGEGKNGR